MPSNDLSNITNTLSHHPNIELAIVFGSVAADNASRNSDLDIAIQASGLLGASDKIQLISELAEVTGRPIDLIDLKTVGQPLLGEILSKGRRILGSNSDYAKLIYKNVLDAADFLPYRNRILKQRREKWLKN